MVALRIDAMQIPDSPDQTEAAVCQKIRARTSLDASRFPLPRAGHLCAGRLRAGLFAELGSGRWPITVLTRAFGLPHLTPPLWAVVGSVTKDWSKQRCQQVVSPVRTERPPVASGPGEWQMAGSGEVITHTHSSVNLSDSLVRHTARPNRHVLGSQEFLGLIIPICYRFKHMRIRFESIREGWSLNVGYRKRS